MSGRQESGLPVLGPGKGTFHHRWGETWTPSEEVRAEVIRASISAVYVGGGVIRQGGGWWGGSIRESAPATNPHQVDPPSQGDRDPAEWKPPLNHSKPLRHVISWSYYCRPARASLEHLPRYANARVSQMPHSQAPCH